MKVCIRPLQALPGTTAVVHCYVESGDWSSAYDNHGVHPEVNRNDPNRQCVQVTGASLPVLQCRASTMGGSAGNWTGGNFNLVFNNCCHYIDNLLRNAGSPGVETYFPGYTLPPNIDLVPNNPLSAEVGREEAYYKVYKKPLYILGG